MIFILNGASFSSTIGTIPNISRYIGSVGTGGTGGSTEPINVILTFNYSPASATLTLTYNDGTSNRTKTDTGDGTYQLTVKSGTSISWTLKADGYNNKSGTIVMPAWNKTETQSLVSSGGSGGTDTPVNPPSGTTTWYTGYDVMECRDKSSAAYGGFAYNNATMLSKLRNKPINVISVNISKAGTFTVGIVDSSNAVIDSVTVTISNPGIQTIELGKTLKATDGQRPFVQKPSDTAQFLYQMNNTISGFPTGMDAYVGVKTTQAFANYNMNINFGYKG